MTKKRNGVGQVLGREIVKWVVSLLVSAALLLACAWLYDDAEKRPVQSVFTGRAQGMMCEIVATITVSKGKIVDVKLSGPEETPAMGGKALEELPAKILEAQSADVDGLAGATVTAEAAKAAVREAMIQADLLPALPVSEIAEEIGAAS